MCNKDHELSRISITRTASIPEQASTSRLWLGLSDEGRRKPPCSRGIHPPPAASKQLDWREQFPQPQLVVSNTPGPPSAALVSNHTPSRYWCATVSLAQS